MILFIYYTRWDNVKSEPPNAGDTPEVESAKQSARSAARFLSLSMLTNWAVYTGSAAICSDGLFYFLRLL